MNIIIAGICIYIIFKNYKKNQFISSTTIWVLCYFLIFVITPTFSIETYTNKNKIEIIALGGIISFYIGTLFTSYRTNIHSNHLHTIYIHKLPKYETVNIIFWIFFIISIYTLIRTNSIKTISEILNSTMTSKELALTNDKSLDSYSIAIHIMFCTALTMWIKAKGKKQQINSVICLSLYTIETLLFGFTRLFLITLIGIIIVYQLRYKTQRKQVIYTSIGSLVLFVTLITMNFVRCFGIKGDVKLKEMINIEYILESSDFSASYYWFDKLLDHESPYISPITYLKPLFVFIPRTVWHNKPEQTSMQILKYIDPAIMSTGYSTAGNSVLGEGYAMIGPFGMFLFPFIWGLICCKLDKRYFFRLKAGKDKCIENFIYYIFAVFIVISGQRGDWNQYMILVIWLYILPIYLLSLTTKNKSKYTN